MKAYMRIVKLGSIGGVHVRSLTMHGPRGDPACNEHILNHTLTLLVESFHV